MNGYGPPAGGFGHPRNAGSGAPAPVPIPPPRKPADRPRRCGCQGPVPCDSVTRARLGLLTIGTRRAYRCQRCGLTFRIRSAGHIAVTLLYASFLSGVGVLIVLYPPGSAVGADSENRWFGVALLVLGLSCIGWGVAMIRAHVKYPAV